MDLLNYQTSIISTILKWITPLVFLFGAYLFYRARKYFSGEMKLFVISLALTGLFGFLAHVFRLVGGYVTMWKWGESIGYLIFGGFNVYSAWRAAGPLVNYVKKMLSSI